MVFRELSKKEEQEFKQWAVENYESNTEISELWHPIIQNECKIINDKTNQND